MLLNIIVNYIAGIHILDFLFTFITGVFYGWAIRNIDAGKLKLD